MKNSLSILSVYTGMVSLLLGAVESLGPNGRVTIPSEWIVDQQSPVLVARTPDYSVVVTAFANPVAHPSIWALQPAQKEALVQTQWDSRVLEALQGFFAQGLAVLNLTRGSVAFGLQDNMYGGIGNYTIIWSDFNFSFETRGLHRISYDRDHVYSINTSASKSATLTARNQSLSILNSLSSTNTLDATADNDGDGLRQDWEFVQGSSDSDLDSDDDGLPDSVESELGTNLALNQLPLLKSLIAAYPQAFDGVFTDEQVANGGLGSLFVEVNAGAALLTLSVLASDDLANWTEVKQVQSSVPVSDGAKFFRFELK